jgi:hypothetical protein
LKTWTQWKLAKLVTIPLTSTGQLTQLPTMNIIDLPSLIDLPSTMSNFQQLVSLTLSNTGLSRVQLYEMQQLQTLSIQFNPTLTFVELMNLSKLSTLITTDNDEQLVSITMRNLPLVELATMSKVKRLQTIDMFDMNGIKSSTLSMNPMVQSVTLNNSIVLTSIHLSKKSHHFKHSS